MIFHLFNDQRRCSIGLLHLRPTKEIVAGANVSVFFCLFEICDFLQFLALILLQVARADRFRYYRRLSVLCNSISAKPVITINFTVVLVRRESDAAAAKIRWINQKVNCCGV